MSADKSSHVPLLDFVPPEAAASQSLGQVISARMVPVSAAAQFAGAEPVLIRMMAEVPTAVSIASSRALRTVVESWIAMLHAHRHILRHNLLHLAVLVAHDRVDPVLGLARRDGSHVSRVCADLVQDLLDPLKALKP